MSSCAASCFTFYPPAWFASVTSDSSPTADEVLRLNAAAFCSAQQHAPIRPTRLACAVQHAPASCSSSKGSPAAGFTSIRAWPRPSQGAAVLTVHERLTAPGVVIHLPSCRTHARKDRRAFWLGPCPSPSASAIVAPDSTSAETRVRPARLVPPRRSNTRKSHLAPIQIP